MSRTRTAGLTPWHGGALGRRLCTLVFLFAPCSVLSTYQILSAATQDNSAETHSAEGLALAKVGNLQAAEVELRKAADLAPANADFLEELATVLAMEKKFEESTSYFHRALKIDPRNAVARRYLAANLWQLHRYAEARQNLLLLLNANPGDPQALLLLGMVSENTKDYATAAKTLASVPTLVRVQPESVAALARSYYHLGQTEKARAWLNELQNHPAGVQAALLGAQIADEMQDYKTAETLLFSVVPRYSDRNDLRYRIALVKFHARQFEESRQLLQQLLDDGHRTSKVNRLLASCFLAQNRNEEAIHALQEAIEFDPLDEASYLDLASILLGQKRISQAMDLAQRMAKAFPDSSRVFVSKGSIELGANDFIDAVSSFTRAAQLEPNSSDATIGLARAEANAGMTERAKATLDSAIRRFPEKAPFELELGLMLLKEAETGDKSAEFRAKQLFNFAVAHDGKLAEAHYELGELALHRGETSRALIQLEKAAKLVPSSAKTHFALSRVYRRLGRGQEAAEQAALFDKLRE